MTAAGRPASLDRRAVSGSAVRAAEAPLLAAGRGPALMRRAAWGLAEHVAAELRRRGRVSGATVAALVGPGNNGGDALFALAFLRRRGVRCVAVPVARDHAGAPRWHAEGWAALRRAGGSRADAVPAGADVVVDGILGTGFTGSFALPAAVGAPPAGAAVVACDVPSGVDADTGEVRGGVLSADLTVTFGALKTGLLLGDGAAAAGRLALVDIGLGPHLPAEPSRVLRRLLEADVRELHPAPAGDAHKYTRGLVGVVAGSERYPGAAVLAVGGALAAGAGLVHHAAEEMVGAGVLAAHPEALTSREGPDPERAAAWVVGPGLDADDGAARRWERARDAVLAAPHAPLVVDASALALVTAADLAALRAAGASVVLTPHAGEWGRLTERIPVPDLPGASAAPEADAAAGERTPADLAALRGWTAAHGATVLLKGPRTLVVGPDGEAWLMADGGPELGVGGTGDVLAGVLGAVLGAAAARARHDTGDDADVRPSVAALAAAGAWLHARAGRRQAVAGRAGAADLPDGVRAVLAGLWWR